jgi:RNA polymerase primary sigma factor
VAQVQVSSGAAGQPGLSADQERRLVRDAQAGCVGAREGLVEAYRPLIARVARLYRGSLSVDRSELMQEGVVGLLRALERYDPGLGTPFWAYASWWVRQAMQQLVSELTRPVVLSDRAVRQLARVKQAERVHRQAHRREPSLRELAADTGLGCQHLQQLVAAERKPRGFEEPLGGEEGADTFGDLVADPCAEDAYDRVPGRVTVGVLEELLGALTERERAIVRARFGLDGRERTLRELGERLGVSAERVRQIEGRALEKLRHAAHEPA